MFGKKKEEVVPVESSHTPSPFEGMESWFEEAFGRPFSLFPGWMVPGWMPSLDSVKPSVDIFDEGDDLVVKAELPGLSKDDVKVSVADDVLTISGEKKRAGKFEGRNYYRVERSWGSFTRSFRLPASVQLDKARAKFRNGVLELRLPKIEPAKTKEITVEIA